MADGWWEEEEEEGPAFAAEAENNNVGRKIHQPRQFVPARNASSPPALPQQRHCGSEPGALRAVLINYLPVAANTSQPLRTAAPER